MHPTQDTSKPLNLGLQALHQHAVTCAKSDAELHWVRLKTELLQFGKGSSAAKVRTAGGMRLSASTADGAGCTDCLEEEEVVAV